MATTAARGPPTARPSTPPAAPRSSTPSARPGSPRARCSRPPAASTSSTDASSEAGAAVVEVVVGVDGRRRPAEHDDAGGDEGDRQRRASPADGGADDGVDGVAERARRRRRRRRRPTRTPAAMSAETPGVGVVALHGHGQARRTAGSRRLRRRALPGRSGLRRSHSGHNRITSHRSHSATTLPSTLSINSNWRWLPAQTPNNHRRFEVGGYSRGSRPAVARASSRCSSIARRSSM